MSVKLAAQLLSESVGTSLRYCLDKKLSEFSGCQATIDFIVLFNTLFDIMNSRNLKSSGYKCPIQKKNVDQIKDFLVKAETYIRSIRLRDGQEIIKSNRKTGFVGFLFCIRSLQILYEIHISPVGAPLNYLLTYKLSQDHIELFFGQIRSMGGSNNNPTVRQFSAAYKKLLVWNDIMDVVKGNCLPLKSVPILTVSSAHGNNASVKDINASLLRNRVLDDTDKEYSNDGNEDYIYIPSNSHLSKCSSDIVAYIAGFVVFTLKKSLHCEICIDALTLSNASDSHSLIKLKTKGNLIYPSDDVIDICVMCEKKMREIMSCTKSLGKAIFHKLVISVLESFKDKQIFTKFTDHMYDSEPLENHIHLLTKAVAEKYLHVRYNYAGKQLTAKLQSQVKVKSRQIYTKLIQFSGQ